MFLVEAEGFSQLVRRLEGVDTSSPEFRAALRRAASLVRRAVRPETPVDSGRTRRAWQYEIYKVPPRFGDGWGATVTAGRNRFARYRRAKSALTAAKGGRQHIVRFLEFGTKFMAPRSFVARVEEQVSPDVEEILVRGYLSPL